MTKIYYHKTPVILNTQKNSCNKWNKCFSIWKRENLKSKKKMFTNTLKNNLLALKTFLNYKVDDFIGYKIIDLKSGTLVNVLWWKVFAKFKS